MTRHRLHHATERARREGRTLFVPFWVLGDPDEETSLDVLRGLLRAGADVLEVGIPFSDPPADGPVVQAADERALAAGMTPRRALTLIGELRSETETPIVALVYANLVAQYEGGIDGFVRDAAHAGLDALLLADVPLEEHGPFAEASARHAVALAQMVTELTSDARLAEVAEVAEGYLYVVSRLGTTGTHASIGGRLADTLARARRASSLPLFAGFGIATPDDVRAARAAGADGVIVGSALVALAAEHAADTLPDAVEARARPLALAAGSVPPSQVPENTGILRAE
jgi:tryptophan synthase alpha chain